MNSLDREKRIDAELREDCPPGTRASPDARRDVVLSELDQIGDGSAGEHCVLEARLERVALDELERYLDAVPALERRHGVLVDGQVIGRELS